MSFNYKISLVQHPEQAKSAWNHFSSGESLYDCWDFRLAFYRQYDAELCFYVAYEGERPVALLPLQYTRRKNLLEFLGGYWMEENRLFLAEGCRLTIGDFVPEFRFPYRLAGIEEASASPMNLPLEDYKYVFGLEGLTGYDDFIDAAFSADTRKVVRRRIRKIEENSVQIVKNSPADLELLFGYNIATFGADSSFNNPENVGFFRWICNSDFDVQLLTLLINGEKVAVSLSLIHNGIYYGLNSGANKTKVPNSGSYLTLQNIESAIRNGCRHYDALMGSYNWKENWHFQKIPYYILQNQK
jgi:CelD/BcsL family acetyltransferase involved in cellulose biosynthesis